MEIVTTGRSTMNCNFVALFDFRGMSHFMLSMHSVSQGPKEAQVLRLPTECFSRRLALVPKSQRSE